MVTVFLLHIQYNIPTMVEITGAKEKATTHLVMITFWVVTLSLSLFKYDSLQKAWWKK